jgi:hypothetical protein
MYKRNDDGSVFLHEVETVKMRLHKGREERVAVKSRQPIIDDELDEVANRYLQWLEEMSPARTHSKGFPA